MERNYRNATFSEALDNLIGDKGFKTDVAVSIAPAMIPILIGSVIVAVIGGILIAGFIQKAIKK